MKSTEWTEQRKKICDDLWNHCAQESCEEPCERVIEVEKTILKLVGNKRVGEILP